MGVQLPEPVRYFLGTLAILVPVFSGKLMLDRRRRRIPPALPPEQRLPAILARVASDGALLERLAGRGSIRIQLKDPSGRVSAEVIAGEGDVATTVDVVTANPTRCEEALAERTDPWAMWARRDLVLHGDEAACLAVTDALIRVVTGPRAPAGG